MENGWQSLEQERKLKVLNNGKIVIIAPKDLEKTVIPLFCPICELPMKTREDGLAYRKFGCCEKCDYRWTNTPSVSWEEGKFPNKGSEEWKEYFDERLKLLKPIIRIK